MATFTQEQQNTSPYATMPLHTPDFGFLAKVYSTKQAQYDRGFDKVQSFYSSLLNGELTNPDNRKFREDAFKKIESSIKSFSHVDLSKGSNIQLAFQAIDPISKDKDFASDLILTRQQNETKQKMEMIRNSNDPDIRNQYNEDSALWLQFVDEDMANAKRGTGEIQAIQPARFIPKQDISKYLNEAAKEQGGLKFQQTQVGNDGYIYTITNGPGAGKTFGQWATTMMGDKFNEQIALSGQMQAESMIRSFMKENGASREQAQVEIAKVMEKQLFGSEQSKLELLSNRYTDTQKELALLEKYYTKKKPDGTIDYGEKTYLEGRHEALKAAVIQYEKDMKNSASVISEITSGNQEYIKNNLGGLLKNTISERIALEWGDAYANSNMEQKIDYDQAWGTKQRMALERYKHDIDTQIRLQELDIRKKEFGLKQSEAEGTFTFLGYQPAMAKFPITQALQESHTRNMKDLKSAFASDGIISIAFKTDNEKMTNYSNAGQRLINYTMGQGELSNNDKERLKAFANDVGIEYREPKNQKEASVLVRQLSLGLLETSGNMAIKLDRIGQNKDIVEQIQNERLLMNTLDNINTERESITEVNKIIDDAIKRSPDVYKNVEPSLFIDGVQTYDLSNLSEAQIQHLSSMMPSQLRTLETSPAVGIQQSQLNEKEINFIKNLPENALITNSQGKKAKVTSEMLRTMNIDVFDDVFGNNAKLVYNPSAQSMTIELSPIIDKSKEYGIKKGEILQITVPYSTVQSYNALDRWGSLVNKYSTKFTPLNYTERLYENPTGRYNVLYGETSESSGLKIIVSGGDNVNGQSGATLHYKVKNPDTNEWTDGKKFYPINDTSNPYDYKDLEQGISVFIQSYKDVLNRQN